MRESDKLNYKNDDIFENLKTIRDMEGIFKNINYIYIYIYTHTHECKSVCAVRRKKKNKTCFFKEKETFGQERKNKFKISQFKSVKALAIA